MSVTDEHPHSGGTRGPASESATRPSYINLSQPRWVTRGHSHRRVTRALVSASVKRLLNDETWRQDLRDTDCRQCHVECLHQVLLSLNAKHGATLSRLCDELRPNQTTAYNEYMQITTLLFQDEINWGRIATMIAFSARLVVYFRANGMPNMVPSLMSWLERRISEDADLVSWIDQNNGWDGFYEAMSEQYADTRVDVKAQRGRSTGIWSWTFVGLLTLVIGAAICCRTSDSAAATTSIPVSS